MKFFHLSLATLLAVLAVSAIAFAQHEVTTDYDHKVNFTAYHTYYGRE